jgi:hypothetical protein
MPVIERQAREIREELFAEVNFHSTYEPKRCIRIQRWKSIRYFDDCERPVLVNYGDGDNKNLWLDHDWESPTVVREELYYLLYDPNENRNLANEKTAAEPAARAALEDMRARLDRWMRDTHDPLAHPAAARRAGVEPG